MENKQNTYQWTQYLETPIRQSTPIKLDEILEARMKAFLQAREARVCLQEL